MNEQPKNGWQPMDTAPKDRRILLVNDMGYVYACDYAQSIGTAEEAWLIAVISDTDSLLLRNPIFWHELPELPVQ